MFIFFYGCLRLLCYTIETFGCNGIIIITLRIIFCQKQWQWSGTFIMTWETDLKNWRRGLPSSPDIEIAIPDKISRFHIFFLQISFNKSWQSPCSFDWLDSTTCDNGKDDKAKNVCRIAPRAGHLPTLPGWCRNYDTARSIME